MRGASAPVKRLRLMRRPDCRCANRAAPDRLAAPTATRRPAMFRFMLIPALLLLAGCIDVDFTLDFTGRNSASADAEMRMTRSFYDMIGQSPESLQSRRSSLIEVLDRVFSSTRFTMTAQ
jgi:hypothetical protein